MEIYKQDAELKLFQNLKEDWSVFPENRCFHLKLSQVEMNEDRWFENLIPALKDIFDLTPCRIYLCRDNDVFILGRHISTKIVNQVLSSVMPHLIAPASAQNQRLADLFEIGVDWPRLRALCEKKIENLNKTNEPFKQVKKIKPATLEQTLSMIDRTLGESLSQRRAVLPESDILMIYFLKNL